MKKIKIGLFVLFLCLCGFNAVGQISIGAGSTTNISGTTGGSTGTNYIGFLARIQYQIMEKASASFDYTYWANNNPEFSLNFNGYYNLLSIGEGFDFSAMAGLNYTKIDEENIISPTSLQIGALFEFPLGKFDLGIEPKYLIDGGRFQVSGFLMIGGDAPDRD